MTIKKRLLGLTAWQCRRIYRAWCIGAAPGRRGQLLINSSYFTMRGEVRP